MSTSAKPPEHAPEDGLDPEGATLWSTAELDPATPEVLSSSRAMRMSHYLLLNEIGKGGVGVVYRARDPKTGRDVALKALRRGRHADETTRARFLREARVTATLRHPNVVAVYDVGEDDGQPFFTMQLVRGEPLSRQLAHGPLEPQRAATLMAMVADGLHHVHERGLVHRDVKPGNILMDEGDVPLLADFGVVQEAMEDETRLTADDHLVGTIAYVAPEQLTRNAPTSASTDLYALGVVLYRCLAGHHPYAGGSPAETMDRIVDAAPAPLPTSVPAPLARICARAMAASPSDRYPSAAAFADDLRRWLRGDPPLMGRRGASTLALATALAVTVATLAFAGWRLNQGTTLPVAPAQEIVDAATAALEVGDLRATTAMVNDATASLDDADVRSATWRWWSETLAAQGDLGGATAHAARALAATDNPQLRHDALVAMAGQRWAARDLVALERVEALARRDGDTALGALPVAATALTRDLVPGRQAATTPQAPAILDALSHALPLDRAADTARATRARTAPRADLVAWDPVTQVIWRWKDVGAPAERYTIPSSWRMEDEPLAVSGVGLPDDVLLARDRSDCEVAYLLSDQVVPGPSWRCASQRDAVVADTDGDGTDEVYVSANRDLVRLSLTDGVATPHPGTRATNSEVVGLDAVDLDGDGDEELLVAMGGWIAEDVRVLDRHGDDLRLIARRRLGRRMSEVVPVRTPAGLRIAAVQSEGEQHDIDEDGRPVVHTEGLTVLELTGTGLDITATAPWPLDRRFPASPTGQTVRHRARHVLLSADLDGDGVDELVASDGHTNTVIYALEDDGAAWAPVAELLDAAPLTAGQLDDDPADELVVALLDQRRELYVLGAGTAPLPQRTLPPAATRPPPPELDRDTAAAWLRLEDLVHLGLLEPAIDELEALAGRRASSTTATRAWIRAAELHEQAGDVDAALHAWRRASEDPAARASATLAAHELAWRDRRLSTAFDLGSQRLSYPPEPPGLQARVDALAEDLAQPVTRWSFAGGFPDAWQLRDGAGVDPTADPDGLWIEGMGDAVIARVPVRWTGRAIHASVTADVKSLAWGTELGLFLVDRADGAEIDLWSVRGMGGGTTLTWNAYCGARQFTFPYPIYEVNPVPLSGIRRYDLDLSRDLTVSTCTVVEDDLQLLRQNGSGGALLQPGVALWLELRSAASPAVDRAALVLHDMELAGLTVRDDHDDDDDVWRAILAGDVPDVDPRAPVAALYTALLGGDDNAARDAFAGLADADATRLLALDPDRLEAVARAALGPRYHLTLIAGAAVDIHAGRPGPAIRLRDHAAGLRQAASGDVVDPASRRAYLDGLIGRALAWIEDGQTDKARADLDLAARLRDTWLAATPGVPDVQLARRIHAIGELRARAALADGDPDAAARALRQALAASPAPETFADVLFGSTFVDALHDHPVWTEVAAARAGRRAVSPEN